MVLLGIAAGAQAGDLYVGGTKLTVGQSYNGSNGPSCLWAGTITFTDATHVTLENVTLNLNASGGVANRTAISSDINYLVITLVGENKIQGDGVKTGLYLSYTTSIKGDGSLDIVAVENGIEAPPSAPLTITDAYVKAKGGTNGIKGSQSILTIKGNGTFEAYGGTKCVASIKRLGEGTAVTGPSGATFNSSVLSVVDEDNNPIKNQWVVIEKAIAVNETNFPDENFRQWIFYRNYGKDGVLTDEEIATVTEIDFFFENRIASLKGIEFFTALKKLSCKGNKLTSLDVSKNTALTYLSCYSNQLTSLDVSKNTALEGLSCSNNQLTSLDVSKNTDLKNLDCYKNQLTSLDVSNNMALTDVWCYGNNIRGESMTTLVKSLPTVKDGIFGVYNKVKPTDNFITTAQVKIAKDKHWRVQMDIGGDDLIDYEGEPVVPIDEENFPDANFRNWVLSQTYGADGYLDYEEIAAVNAIDVSNKNIANLKGIEHFTAVTYLDCSNNQLDGFDVSQNTNLKQLFCSYNMLGGLDVSQNTALSSLGCDHNQLSTLDVSKNTALTILECFNNQLTALDVSQNTALTDLYCYDNRLTTLDVSKNKKLRAVTCYHNVIRGEGMDALVGSLPEEAEGQLVVYKDETIAGNVITTLQVAVAKGRKWKVMRINDIGVGEEYEGSPVVAVNGENFPDEKFRNWVNDQPFSKDGYLDVVEIADVTEIDVSNKGITSLKGIEHFTALLTLQCAMNSLTALDLSQNTALTSLDCSVNNLSALDLSQNTALQSLSCILNNLSTLDLSKNTALTLVACYNNVIRGEGMEALVGNLPTVTSGELRIFNKENAAGNEMTTLQVAAAKAKKWKVLMDGGSGWVDYAGVKVEAKLAFKSTECSTTVGVSFNSPQLTTTPASLKVRYSSSNPDIATVVGEETGVVVGMSEGEVTITASVVSDQYEGSASYRLTVTRNECGMMFSSATASATYGAAFTAPTLTVIPKSLTGSVRYESSDTKVATVDATSGKVTLLKAGKTTITAKFAGDDTYVPASASYVLTVKKGKATLSFSQTECRGERGKAFTAPTLTTSPEGVNVTYASSNSDIARVDAETGAVTIVGVGEATITATVVSDQYEGSASYRITVVKITEGDANGNGTVESGDVVEVVNAMKGSPSSTFQSEAAETTGDEQLNIADIVKIINIITNE